MSSRSRQYPIWLPVGDQGLMLDFTGFTPVLAPQNTNIDEELAQNVASMADALRQLNLAGISEIAASLTRLFIHFDPHISAKMVKEARYPLIITDHHTTTKHRRIWHIPVCYDGACAPDPQRSPTQRKCQYQEVIERHLNWALTVAVMGFLPGLGYMTGVDERLTLPRRANPRTHVPARSVGIAIGQCVIYPLEP